MSGRAASQSGCSKQYKTYTIKLTKTYKNNAGYAGLHSQAPGLFSLLGHEFSIHDCICQGILCPRREMAVANFL